MNDLELLLAERAITRQLTNYCRAMDRCDAELGLSVFHADASLDYGDSYRGDAAGFIDWAMRTHSHMDQHLHRLSNVLIDVQGERAGSESYFEAIFRMSHDGVIREMRGAGRYLDRWELRDGRWAISNRLMLHTVDSVRVLENEPRPITGTRDRLDPSYSVLSL
jgi:hypothetical protein